MRKRGAMCMYVFCTIENFTRRRIAKKEIERIAVYVARAMENKKNAAPLSLSIDIIGETRCAQLNKKFRGIQKATDVLSFPPEPGQPHAFGEIVLCPQVIGKQANEKKVSFRDEFAHVLVHGMLHVLGHHHEESAEKERVLQQKENIICKKLGYGIPHPEV